MGEEADALLRGRFAIIQVWRPINQPVESHPLAICDANRQAETLVVNERRYQGRIGQTYGITYDPMKQRWYWFPQMRPTRRWSSRSTRSLKDGRARWTAHIAFEDPHRATPPKTPREHRNPHPRLFRRG